MSGIGIVDIFDTLVDLAEFAVRMSEFVAAAAGFVMIFGVLRLLMNMPARQRTIPKEDDRGPEPSSTWRKWLWRLG